MTDQWDPAPPTVKQKLVAATFLALGCVAFASEYFGWRLFGDYDKQVGGVTMFVWIVVFLYFMPTVRRF